MKIQTFNRQLIRQYLEGSPILEQGINYIKHIEPTATDFVAKEAAIKVATDFCVQFWHDDTRGHINDERAAFSKFAEYVERGTIWNTKPKKKGWFR